MTSSVVAREAGRDFAFSTYVRRVAAVGCAAVLVGVVVGGMGGRLAMRLLAAANPEHRGQITDDGFVVGHISAGGTVQVLAAAIQFSLLGTAIYLLIRPLLLGPVWLRVATVAVGAGTTLGALLVQPDSFDFAVLDPPLLPMTLFVGIPVVHVAVFVALAERWLADESWFSRAPMRPVAATLLAWLLGAVALVLVLPLFTVALVALVVAARHPLPLSARTAVTWVGRLLLVAIFAGAVVNLARDAALLLA
jgi:hypothetical protein